LGQAQLLLWGVRSWGNCSTYRWNILYNFYKWFSFWTANDSPFELQINIICHKAHIFQTLNHALTNSLIAVVIIHSLSEIYSILKTILLSTSEDKLSTNAIINYILVEEKSQSFQSTSQNMFIAYLRKEKGKM